jgi:hypothetical protein
VGSQAWSPGHAEALGPNYEAAKERVDTLLYPAFRAWRLKRKAPKGLDSGARFGTIDWLFESARRSRRFLKPNERTRDSYREALKPAAIYQEMCDLVDALVIWKDHKALAVAALICFWWHQRPENVLDGHITWADYRPANRPKSLLRWCNPLAGC